MGTRKSADGRSLAGSMHRPTIRPRFKTCVKLARLGSPFRLTHRFEDRPCPNDPNVTNNLVDRLRSGDPQARDLLITHTCQRLERLTRYMLGTFPRVKKWEQTCDVFQNVQIRIHKAISGSKVELKSARHFYQVAANHIRWELRDLAQKYRGPKWTVVNHRTDSTGGAITRVADPASGPDRLLEFADFQQKAKELPPKLREVFDLIWYNGMTCKEAAEILGVSEKTVKRLWAKVRLALDEACNGEAPSL